MYRVDEDRSWVIPRIELVNEWLDANQDEQAGSAAQRVECRQAFKQARKHRRKAPKGEADT